MHSPALLHSWASDGLGTSYGSLWWPRPYFPGRYERARLVAAAVPDWAIATDSTAAWVWTGFGYPEPWRVLRRPAPAISPLERNAWRALALNSLHHRVVTISGLAVLTPEDTTREVLMGAGSPDIAATQVMMLTDHTTAALAELVLVRRSTATQRTHAAAVLQRLTQLRARYPDITR